MHKERRVPIYLMLIGGQRRWLPIRDAGIAYDSGWISISIGGFVIEDGIERKITNEEIEKIEEIADEHSASK